MATRNKKASAKGTRKGSHETKSVKSKLVTTRSAHITSSPGGQKAFSVKETLKSHRLRRTAALILILALVAGALYFGRSIFVAALVNGKPISRLSLVKQLERQAGQQTLDNLVTKELIFQEASKKGVVTNDADVQSEIDKLTKVVEAQGITLENALAMQGQSRRDLEDTIRIQKTVEVLLAEKLVVTDEDVKAYFDQNKETYGKDAKFESLQEEIRNQLKQDKIASEFRTWLEKLKTDSKIIYFVGF